MTVVMRRDYFVATEDQVPACCSSARAMARMKAASSRAIAVTDTVLATRDQGPVALGQGRLCVPGYVSQPHVGLSK